MFPRLIEISRALYLPDKHPVRCFHASFIMRKSRILAIGVNSDKTHPRNLFNPKYGNGTCSELAAVLKLKNRTDIDTSNCNLVNIRINKLGEISNSCPCLGCTSLLKYFNFKNVYYTTESGRFETYS